MPSIIKISTVFALLTAAHAKIDTLNERNLVARSYHIGESSYALTDDSKAGTDSAKKSGHKAAKYASTDDSKARTDSAKKSGYKAAKRSETDSPKTGKNSSPKAQPQINHHHKLEHDQAYPHAAASVPQGYTNTYVKPVKVEDYSSDVPADTPAPVGEPTDVHISPIGDNQGYSSTYPETEGKIDQAGSGDDTSGLADTIDTSNESPSVTDSMSEMEETTISEPSAYSDDTSSDSGILDSSATTVSFVGFAGLISLLFV